MTPDPVPTEVTCHTWHAPVATRARLLRRRGGNPGGGDSTEEGEAPDARGAGRNRLNSTKIGIHSKRPDVK